MAKTIRPSGLCGPEGLLAAIIDQAATDVATDDYDLVVDALGYLGSRYYRHHVESLGLPDSWPLVLRDGAMIDRLYHLVLSHERGKTH